MENISLLQNQILQLLEYKTFFTRQSVQKALLNKYPHQKIITLNNISKVFKQLKKEKIIKYSKDQKLWYVIKIKPKDEIIIKQTESSINEHIEELLKKTIQQTSKDIIPAIANNYINKNATTIIENKLLEEIRTRLKPTILEYIDYVISKKNINDNDLEKRILLLEKRVDVAEIKLNKFLQLIKNIQIFFNKMIKS